jgi:Chs5-Arf1p-binding protein BUD7/BCH1
MSTPFSSLLSAARANAFTDEEVKAVQVINTALKSGVMHYSILHVQCDFLRSKGKHLWALEVAKAAVNSAPSEFCTWAKLTEVYVDLGMHESALLTLNSCPMFTVNERDLHKMPTPWKTHLPIKQYVEESGILEDHNAGDDVRLLIPPLLSS